MRKGHIRVALVIAGLLGLSAAAFSQRFGGRGEFGGFGGFGDSNSEAPESRFSKNAEFHFLPMEYTGYMRRRLGSLSRRGERRDGERRIGRTRPTSGNKI